MKINCTEVPKLFIMFATTMIQGFTFSLAIKKSRIAGKGAFALERIPARKKLGNMLGELISYKEAQKRIRNNRTGVIFMVEFDDRKKALDASGHSNALRFINHSCNPNTFMRRAYYKVEFYAKRAIEAGEELTCDYGETHHDGQLPCNCGAPNCRKFI